MMSGGIHVSYKTKSYAAFFESCGKRQDGQSIQAGTFRSAAERIAQSAAGGQDKQRGLPAGAGAVDVWQAGCRDGKRSRRGEIADAAVTDPVSALPPAHRAEGLIRDMTLEEYKWYISGRIAELPVASSQAGWDWYIDITQAGYEAMKQDPDYEAHVLDCIRRNFSAGDPFHSSTFSILHFGATEEEFYGQSYRYDSPAEHLQDKEESYWEKRKARRKKLQELLDDLAEKKAVARRQGLPEPTMPDINAILALVSADTRK